MSKITHKGACMCGELEFSFSGKPRFVSECVCESCRIAHGATAVAWVGVLSHQFQITAGESSLHWYRSSEDSERGFCVKCGTRILFRSERWPGEVHMALACIQEPHDLVANNLSFPKEFPRWSAMKLERLSMIEANKSTLVKFIDDVWNNGKLENLGSYLDHSYTIHHDPGDPWDQQTLTLDGFRERVSVSRSSAPDQSFDIQTMVADESRVAITWLWSGTHLGEIGDFHPTGKTLRMSGATIYFFDEGKITGHWQISDRLTIYQQLMANSDEQ